MKKLKQTKKNKKGFTFIELLSVIVILSILLTSSTILPALRKILPD